MLAWYDHWLKGADTGIMDGPSDPLPASRRRRLANRDAWPPPESELAATRSAPTACSTEEGDPGRAISVYAWELGRPGNANPPELPDTARSGRPPQSKSRGHSPATSSSPRRDDHRARHQLDRRPLRRAARWQGEPITAGWLRAMLRKVDEKTSVAGAPVVPCREPEVVPLGEPVTYRIPVVPNARRIQPGHTLRLSLTSCDQGKDAPTVLGFRHAPIGGGTLNTILSSSRLLLPILR